MTLLVIFVFFFFWSPLKHEHEEFDELGRAINHRTGHKTAYAGAITENASIATTNAAKAVTAAGLALEGEPTEELTEALTEDVGGEAEGGTEDGM